MGGNGNGGFTRGALRRMRRRKSENHFFFWMVESTVSLSILRVQKNQS